MENMLNKDKSINGGVKMCREQVGRKREKSIIKLLECLEPILQYMWNLKGAFGIEKDSTENCNVELSV